MELTTENTKIKFHLGNPETVSQPRPVETCAFNERIQKIIVEAEELMKEEIEEDQDTDNSVENVEGIVDVEQEEERERMRKEEEVHPQEADNTSCL